MENLIGYIIFSIIGYLINFVCFGTYMSYVYDYIEDKKYILYPLIILNIIPYIQFILFVLILLPIPLIILLIDIIKEKITGKGIL